MTATKAITPHCLTCGEDGHTYIECPKAPFGEIFAGAMGLPDITGQREQVREFLVSHKDSPTTEGSTDAPAEQDN